MFDINYLAWFESWPPELATLVISMLPVTELRAAIPIALGVFHLPVWSALFWAIIGDVIIAFLILWLIGPIAQWASNNSRLLDKIFQCLFKKTRHKFVKKYLRYGNIALMLFVAIPLPATGAWSGAVAAWLFGIPKRTAFLFISMGVLLAGIIVTFISQGAFSFFDWLLI